MATYLENQINSQVVRLFSICPDILARDKNGNPILLVDLDTMQLQFTTKSSKIIEYLTEMKGYIPFAMVVNLQQISIFKWHNDDWPNPVYILPTADALMRYEPEFITKRIFPTYLTTLVEAWLRDLAYHWHSQQPPFLEEIKRIGLLEKLTDGTTEIATDVIEVMISC